MDIRLNDVPDWKYVFQVIYQVYRLGSAGGSSVIRSHQRRVRETISKIVKCNPYYTPRQPENKPVTAHWGRALDLADSGPLANLSRVLYPSRESAHLGVRLSESTQGTCQTLCLL